jgi:predicted ferric reductase
MIALPALLPALGGSLAGEEPKAYWYLARSSAWVAYGLLWLSMVLGITITNRMARVWPGGPTAFDLHQYASLLGMAFAFFHGLVLLGDRYIGYTLPQVLVPFLGGGYRPVWVGLGQLGLYGLAVVGLSFYVKRGIGTRWWRRIHFLSFGVFVLVLIHGVASGTDTAEGWAQGIYWGTGAALLFLTIYRVLVHQQKTRASS